MTIIQVAHHVCAHFQTIKLVESTTRHVILHLGAKIIILLLHLHFLDLQLFFDNCVFVVLYLFFVMVILLFNPLQSILVILQLGDQLDFFLLELLELLGPVFDYMREFSYLILQLISLVLGSVIL